MAFINKIGNILEQTSRKMPNLQSPFPNTSFFQAIRYFSPQLFVGGIVSHSLQNFESLYSKWIIYRLFSCKVVFFFRILKSSNPIEVCFLTMAYMNVIVFAFSGLSYATDENSLREAFVPYGDVVEGIFISHLFRLFCLLKSFSFIYWL